MLVVSNTSSVSLSPSICQPPASADSFSLRRPEPGMLLPPALTIPSILLTPTKPRQGDNQVMEYSPYFKTTGIPSNSPYSTTSVPTFGTPQNNSTPVTPLICPSRHLVHQKKRFPSPLFCSSPTRAVPSCLTPRATPRCPSPINTSSSPSSIPGGLHDNPHSAELRHVATRHVVTRHVTKDTGVRIVGRRLFEDEDEDGNGTTAPASDKIGLLTFILESEQCGVDSQSDISTSLSSSPSSTPPTRLIDATQSSILAKFPRQSCTSLVDNEQAQDSLLLKYPHLFTSILGAGTAAVPRDHDHVSAPKHSFTRRKCDKRMRSEEDTTPHRGADAKCHTAAGSKKRKIKSLLSNVMVVVKHKKSSSRLPGRHNDGQRRRSRLRSEV